VVEASSNVKEKKS